MDERTRALVHSSKYDAWETPKALYDSLNAAFQFQLDAAASGANAKASHWFTKEDDALRQDWHPYESIFINPPYGRGMSAAFVAKAAAEAAKGCTIVMLLPARTCTRWFHAHLYNKPTVELIFLKGRLKFEIDGKPVLDKHGRPQSAPFPSMIAVLRG